MPITRRPDHPVEPLFLSRWSPRAFDGSDIPAADLLTILEAGRWAPSAFNVQPWRFLYAQRGDAHWPGFVTILNAFNQTWARDASVLIFLASDMIFPGDGARPDTKSHYNSFDAGAAWMQIALQASALGYAAHAMAGLNFDTAAQVLNLPERLKLEVGIAIGRQTRADRLPADLREREVPSNRMPLDQIAFAGPHPETATPIAAQ
ncbi:MAG: nitroreductase family protein [Pseudomonadota bacterium]